MRYLGGIYLQLALLGLFSTTLAAPAAQEEAAPIVTTIEVEQGSPKVEIHIVEVIKTVTTTEAICAKETGLASAEYIKAEEIPTATVVTYTETPTGGFTQEPPAATSLLPAVHWDVDLHRHENLQANRSVELFYCDHAVERKDGKPEAPPNNTAVGFLKVDQMQYPAVQLDHTVFIASMTCSNNSIKVTFNNQKAFEIARADWLSHKSDLLLITVDPKCRLATDMVERGYVLVKTMTADNSSMSITGNSQLIGFAQAVGEETPIDFSFGNFHTNGTDGFQAPITGTPGPLNGTVDSLTPSNGTSRTNTTLRDPSGDTGFDATLDRKLGVMTVEELERKILRYNVTLEDISGGDTNIPDLLPVSGLQRRRIEKRLFGGLKKALKKIGNAVSGAVKSVGSAVKQVVGKVGTVIDKGVDLLAKWASITKSINKDLSFDTKSGQTMTSTPWGQGVQLWKKGSTSGTAYAAVYCVDCGAQGKVALEGKVTFSIIKGLQTGYITANGNLHAGLQIGIVAQYKDDWNFDKNILTLPLSIYSIPGIITLGPSLSLSAGAGVHVLAQGQILAGIKADMSNLNVRFDLVDKEKSTGLQLSPQVQPVFDAQGKVVISADAYLALKLAVGINILNGVWDKSVGIVEKPKISLSAGVDASYSLEGGGKWSNPNCKGISLAVGFGNELYFDLFGSKKMISDYKGPSWNRCFALSKRDSPLSIGWNETSATPSNQTVPAADVPNVDGAGFSKIRTAQGALGLHYSPNGNIYAVPPQKLEDPNDPTALFTSDPSGDFIVGDSHGRYLHGYTDEIDTYGIGRLRLHDAYHMPSSASLLSFASTRDSLGESLLVLADLAGAIYFPIICMYEDPIYPKIFLAKEPEGGSLKLEDPQMVSVITGSKVKDCGYLPLTNDFVQTA